MHLSRHRESGRTCLARRFQAERAAGVKLLEQAALMRQMEAAMLHSQHAIPSGASTLHAVLSSPSAREEADALSGAEEGRGGQGEVGGERAAEAWRLMSEQRERARREAEELQAENRRLRDQFKAHQAESRQLQARGGLGRRFRREEGGEVKE